MDHLRIDDYLDPGERVLWMRPAKRGLILRFWDIYVGPVFAFMAGGVCVFSGAVVIGIVRGDVSPLALLLIAPMLIGALYLFPGKYVLDAVRRHWTVYVVTDRRAMIVADLNPVEITSRPLTPEQIVRVTGVPSGNIQIGPESEWGILYLNARIFAGANTHPLCFERLPNTLEVYKIIRKVQTGRV